MRERVYEMPGSEGPSLETWNTTSDAKKTIGPSAKQPSIPSTLLKDWLFLNSLRSDAYRKQQRRLIRYLYDGIA